MTVYLVVLLTCLKFETITTEMVAVSIKMGPSKMVKQRSCMYKHSSDWKDTIAKNFNLSMSCSHWNVKEKGICGPIKSKKCATKMRDQRFS